MSSPRGSVKGAILESRLDFLRSEGGERLVRDVLQRLPEDERRIFGGTLMPMAWYPFDANERLDMAIAEVMGGGSTIFRTLGGYSALHNLGSSHKVYVRESDPHGLLKQAAAIFRLYYDTGHRTYERAAPLRAVLRTHECLSYSQADCLTVVGWHEKAIELCGGRQPKVVERTCRATGGTVCEYVCEWQ